MFSDNFIFRMAPAHRGRWGHRPRRTAPVGVPTNRQKFGMHPFGLFYFEKLNIMF